MEKRRLTLGPVPDARPVALHVRWLQLTRPEAEPGRTDPGWFWSAGETSRPVQLCAPHLGQPWRRHLCRRDSQLARAEVRAQMISEAASTPFSPRAGYRR